MNTPEQLVEKSVDITGAKHCEVRIRRDGKVIWVNVNGICVCRVCRIDELTVEDDRG